MNESKSKMIRADQSIQDKTKNDKNQQKKKKEMGYALFYIGATVLLLSSALHFTVMSLLQVGQRAQESRKTAAVPLNIPTHGFKSALKKMPDGPFLL